MVCRAGVHPPGPRRGHSARRFPGLGRTYRSPRSSATAGSECAQRPISPHGRGSYSGGKKTHDLIAVLHCLLEHDTAGDPMTGLRWSRRTTTTIAEELAKLGIDVSTSSSPNRNLQFEYLAELRDRFQRRHLPIVSVDSKKRELVGNFKNPGRRWEPVPRCVYDHDFRTDSIGVAIPYGIYDVMENRGP